jgi:hypothetical protein
MGAISSDAELASSNTQTMYLAASEQADAAGYHRQDRDQTQQEAAGAARGSSNDVEPERKGFRAKLHQVLCAPTGTAQK